MDTRRRPISPLFKCSQYMPLCEAKNFDAEGSKHSGAAILHLMCALQPGDAWTCAVSNSEVRTIFSLSQQQATLSMLPGSKLKLSWTRSGCIRLTGRCIVVVDV